jgi:hypothetical protein
MAPIFYDIHNFTNITNILLRRNFKIAEFNLNHFMKVKKTTFYENIISKGNLKKLKKSHKKYKLKEDCFNKLEEIYNVLDINRKSKGNKLSLDFKSIQAICKSFQKYIKIFSVIDENEMPLESYTYLGLHPEAKLSDADRKVLVDWAKEQMAMLAATHPADSLKMKPRPAASEE